MKRLLILIVTAGYLFAGISNDSPETAAKNTVLRKAESRPEIFRSLSKLITSIAKVCAGSSKNQAAGSGSKTFCNNSNCTDTESDYTDDDKLILIPGGNTLSNQFSPDEVHQV